MRKYAQDQLSAAGMFVAYDKAIGQIRDAVDRVAKEDSLSLGMKRIRVKELEAREQALYDAAVKRYGGAVRAEEGRKAAR